MDTVDGNQSANHNAGSTQISEHLLTTVSGIQNVSHIHVWSLTSNCVLATIQMQPLEGADI